MYMDRFNRSGYGPYGEPPGQNGSYVNPYQPYRLPTERNPGTDPTVADPVIQDPYSSGVRPATGHNPGGANPATDAPQMGYGVRPWWANPTYLYAGMGGLRFGAPTPYQMSGGYRPQYVPPSQPTPQPPTTTPTAYQTNNSYSTQQQGQMPTFVGRPYGNRGAGPMFSTGYSQQPQYGGGYGGITGGFMGGRY